MKNIFAIIIAFVLLIAIVSGAMFYNQIQQQKIELSSIQVRITLIDEEIVQTKEKIANLQEENTLLRQQIVESEEKINAYNIQASELGSEKERTLDKLQDKRGQLNSLKEELEYLGDERDVLTSKLKEILTKGENINNEIMELSKGKRQLEEDIKKYVKPGKGVELEKIVVKLSQDFAGSVLEANNKYGFAIIDVGETDGIIVGDILDVYRDNNLICEATVEKVFLDFSSIVPSEGFTDIKFKISDEVILAR